MNGLWHHRDMATPDLDLDGVTPAQLRARRCLKWTRFPPDVLPMWVAEMDYPADPGVVEAIRRGVAAHGFGYPSRLVMDDLATAVATYQAKAYGWEVDPEGVVVLGDVMQGIALAIDLDTPTAAPVVVPAPVYPPFYEVTRLSGRRLVRVPMLGDDDLGWRLDLQAVDEALAARGGTVLLCHPHNPLGVAHPVADLETLAEIVERRGARVVSDEVHAPLSFDAPHVPYARVSEAAAGHSVTVTSASKAWNVPGLKCAQVLTSSERDAARWRGLSMWRTVGVSTLGMEANIAAYSGDGAWLAAVRDKLAGHRDLVADAVAQMPGVGHHRVGATYLAWLDFSALQLTQEPSDWLLAQARVALNDGPPFGAPARRFARLNFATTTPLLREGLGRIAEAVTRRVRHGG